MGSKILIGSGAAVAGAGTYGLLLYGFSMRNAVLCIAIGAASIGIGYLLKARSESRQNSPEPPPG